MAGPPTDISPSDLWLQLSSAERPNKLVEFPRWNEGGESVGQVRIRVLTQQEQMTCAKAAEDTARQFLKEAKKGDLGYDRLFTDALCIEVLFRACRDANDPKRPAFPTPMLMREMMTTEEAAKLFEHYLTVQLELGPTANSMSDEECEAWIDRLVGGGGSVSPFDLLTWEQQRILVMYLAFKDRSSRKDTTSAGTPPVEVPTSTEQTPI